MAFPSTSVVIPTWNERSGIITLLNKIRAQTVPPEEVIVVDKFSSDGTGKCAESMGAKVIYDLGSVAMARNVGAQACSGDIVAFTEGDAVVPQRWIEIIASKFEKISGLLALAGPGSPYDFKGVPWDLKVEYMVYNAFRAFMGRLGWFMCSGYNMAVRRRIFNRVQFPDVVPNDDGLFGKAVSKLGQTRFSPDLAVQISSRRFRKFGFIQGNLYYIFMLGNLFPVLMPITRKLRWTSQKKFNKLRE